MSKNVKYVQCELRRNVGDGSAETTSYIPQKFAKVGHILKLKDDNDDWVDGWVVQQVGTSIVQGDQIPDSHKAINNHRKATGDSSPRRRS